MSLVAQILLGWLLKPADYALYGAALPYAQWTEALRNGGLPRLLLTRGRHYDKLAWPALRIATGFNVLSACLLFTMAVGLWLAGHTGVAVLVSLFAVSSLVSSPAGIFDAKLNIDLKFRAYSGLMLLGSLVHFTLAVILAWKGAGAASLVVPMILVQLLHMVILPIAAGGWPRPRPFSTRRMKVLVWSSRWVMASTFALALSSSGDYFVLSFLRRDLLGEYVFGFQLSVAFVALLGHAIGNVIIAGLAKFNQDLPRLRVAVARSIALTVFLSVPMAAAGAAAIPWLVTFIWQGRWDAAVPAAVAMTLVAPITLAGHVARSAQAARGDWTTMTLVQLVIGLLVMAATAVGTRWDMAGVVFGVAVALSVGHLLLCFWTMRAIGGLSLLTGPAVRLTLLTAAAAAVTGGLWRLAGRPFALDTMATFPFFSAGVAAAFVLVYGGLAFVVARAEVVELIGRFRHAFLRRN